jgi:hypothetical protein
MGIDRETLAKFLQTDPRSLEVKCLAVLHNPATFVAENFSHDETSAGAHKSILQMAANVVSDGRRQRLLETPRVNS